MLASSGQAQRSARPRTIAVGVRVKSRGGGAAVDRDCLTSGPVVREGGLEPPHPYGHRNLNPARLPIPPLARVDW